MSKKIWTYIMAFLCIISGIFLLVRPEQSTSNIIYNIGLIMLIVGICKIISAVFSNNNVLLPGNYFFSGTLNSIFGIILMNNTTGLTKSISVIIGVWLIINSALNLGMIINYKKVSNVIDIKTIILNVLKLILGIIIMTTPIVFVIFTSAFLGIILILIGIAIIYNDNIKGKFYSVKIK